MLLRRLAAGVVLPLCAAPLSAAGLFDQTIELSVLGTYESGIFAEGAAEIAAHDPATQRLFVTNADASSVDVLDISLPAAPTLLFTIDLAPYGGGVNSVAVDGGRVAVAVEADVKQDPGKVVFFDTDGNHLAHVEVGALPDMVTFTPNGRVVLVANEGEPNDDYSVDPEGSISVIWLPGNLAQLKQQHVRTADFRQYDQGRPVPQGVRIFGPGASVAQDLEPEYIAVSRDSSTAWVTLQENNALAKVDIRHARVVDLLPLGSKDHAAGPQTAEGVTALFAADFNGLDASDRDDAINIRPWPVQGLYLPDAIASYTLFGRTFLLTANEGDARDYDGFSEEARVKDLVLDPVAYPDAATLQLDENLGRLKTTVVDGDADLDGDVDQIFSYGARSFSIWSEDGALVYDSGEEFEQILARALPDDFNATNDENGSFDNRSDDKGPEPEGITIGKVGVHTYAFIGLERVG
ncbi:MAG: choice-of-anchor I family protein, partial [Pseudomonadota bacterium]|nr:choice-of-anchor I family protein [Pseudomonadota bacterium]